MTSMGATGTVAASRLAQTAFNLCICTLLLAFVLGTAGAQTCSPPPGGLASWWRADATYADQAGANNGAPAGNTSFGTGKVGQAFVFGGSNGDGVLVGNASNLQLQDLTIEAWIKRSSTTATTRGPFGGGTFFGFGNGGYTFGLLPNGSLGLGRAYISQVLSSAGLVSDTNYHHVAVTKSGSTVVFYADGVAYAAPAYNPGFTFGTTAAVGALGDLTYSFWGSIDELTVYGRPLAASEIQAIYNASSTGKCVGSFPPSISSQPANEAVFIGDTALFSVTAAGTVPLSYQWSFNGGALAGATNSSLALPNVQPAQAGSYTVLVTNLGGMLLSSNAILTVNASGPCSAAPSGLASWWRAEGNAFDQMGANNGTLSGATGYGAGRVGQGFTFGGFDGDGVVVGSASNLRVQTLTIECWIKRASTTQSTRGALGGGTFFGFGLGGYTFGMLGNGSLGFGKAGVSQVLTAPGLVADSNYHHVAVTKSGNSVVFYVDGTAYAAPAYDPGFTFGTSAAVGALGDLSYSFWGSVDELAVYTRGLSASEIQAIYAAGSSGKCLIAAPPTITSQPASQTAFVNDTVTLRVAATGTLPLSYQWNFNGGVLEGATTNSLVLANLQLSQAGTYTVLVTNLGGALLSSNAVLMVTASGPCTSAPSGLASWWRADGTAFDQLGVNNGTPSGGTSYGIGRVRQAFVFGGFDGDGVLVGSATNLQLQDLTIEAWIKRSSTTQTTRSPQGGGTFFGFGNGGYTFGLLPDGRLGLGKAYISQVLSATGLVVDTNYHHVAVTKSGGTVIFYVDGTAYSAPAYNPGFTFGTQAAVGALGDLTYSFLGSVDELAVYPRPLTASEIQAIYGAGSGGKCLIVTPPTITSQPASQTVFVGDPASFTVAAAGTQPLSYQWNFNGSAIAGATISSLALTNVHVSQAGTYTVLVTNPGATVLSSNALLTVNQPGPCTEKPSGLVSWWRAQGNALDQTDGNNGTPSGNISYATGAVGQGFTFGGFNGDGVVVGTASNLQLQDLTIEGWVKRSSATQTTHSPQGGGTFFGFGNGGYTFGMLGNGSLGFGKASVSQVLTASGLVTDTNYHHVAVTKTGSSVVFYVDGTAYAAPAYDPGFTFGTAAAVGALGDLTYSFWGSVDELSVYNRSLASSEIQAVYGAGSGGKCFRTNSPPTAASSFPAATKRNQAISIPTAKILVFCSDPDGDPLSMSGVGGTSANGGAVVLGADAISYTPPTDFLGTDTFGYSISDGQGGSASGSVSVVVRSADQQSGNMLPPVPIAGGYQVSFFGLPGRTYHLQRAPAVTGPWTTLAAVTTDANGLGTYADTNAPAEAAYYRTIYP